MAGYSRADFSRHSKDQLLDYIEQQAEQLNRFDTRFRDVVRAYRGALKEKEALEQTLKALSVQQEEMGVESGVEEGEEGERKGEEESDACDSVRIVGSESETDDADKSASEQRPHLLKSPLTSPTVNQLKQQISTMTAAMATLTQEKSKMEASFQKDKKAALSTQDVLTKQLQAETETVKRELFQYQCQLEEVQEALRSEQKSRLEEQKTHAEMLKELQSLLVVERDNQEALKTKVHGKEVELERLKKQISEDRTREYEDNLKIMSVELEQVRSRLMAAEKQAHQPPPLLLQLQEDMTRMKDDHSKSIETEQHRANDAETRLHLQAQREELRVANLESQLAELSKTVGGYDQQRETDQMAIQKLKQRIAQLDSENTVLTKVHMERQDTLSNEASSQVGILQEKLTRMKALLKQATLKINEKTVFPSDVEELTVSDYNELLSMEPSRKEYEQELYQLKDEFEKYKLRAQSVLKSRGSKMDSEVTNEELKKLANQNRELQEQLALGKAGQEEQEERHLVRTKKLREEMRDLHHKHKQQSAALESTHKQKLLELSSQMQSTRERSLKLIAEKDEEIQYLKTQLLEYTSSLPSTPITSLPSTPITASHRQKNSYNRTLSTNSLSDQASGFVSPLYTARDSSQEPSVEPNNDTSASASLLLPLKPLPDSTQTAVQELLDQPSPQSSIIGGMAVGRASDVRLLHHAQEQQRRKEETILARRKLFELEDTIRELQEREERHMEQTGFLKEEIRKLQRDRSRETENLEYLKNIIIHFMSADSAGRDQLISPIATVLHFSKEEVAVIKKNIAARRWLSTKK